MSKSPLLPQPVPTFRKDTKSQSLHKGYSADIIIFVKTWCLWVFVAFFVFIS